MQNLSQDSPSQTDYSGALHAAEHSLEEYKYVKLEKNGAEVGFSLFSQCIPRQFVDASLHETVV